MRRFPKLNNFLAVVHINEHRKRQYGKTGPAAADRALDDESALLLAQNYNEFSSFYPYSQCAFVNSTRQI